MIVRLDAYELIERGERELADGGRSACKTLERARRGLLAKRDVEGLERLLGLALRVDDSGDLAYAIGQNLRFLARQVELNAGSRPAPVPAPRAGRSRSFLFGDPRRPRSLAFALIASIATFPVFWGILLVLYGLSGADSNDPNYPQRAVQSDERTLVVIAAILPAIGLVAATLDWLSARRSYPPEERGVLLGPEGILCEVAVLIVLGAAIALGIVLWNSVI